MTETIAGAAIRLDKAVYSVEPPKRHHHLIYDMSRSGFPAEELHDQGFITSSGRFVDRREGLTIAEAAGQIKEKLGCEGLLFTEDMW